MASLTVGSVLDVDYSISGQIRRVEIHGDLVYLRGGIEGNDWKSKLAKLVCEFKLDEERDRRGLHAFVHEVMTWPEYRELKEGKPSPT
jgi:hypothetical protein